MALALRSAEQQLRRMRGMTALYHRRFFTDVWLTTLVWLGLLVAGDLGAELAWVVLPFVALFGAVITAFDASYLIFARHYAAALERYLNDRFGERILVAAQLEDTYLFPLRERKVVTISRHLTWFGFVTAFLTVLGISAFLFGVFLGLEVLDGQPATALFLAALAIITTTSLVAGTWWFLGGVGEKRLTDILDVAFPLR